VGLYDRDYYRQEPRGASSYAPRTIVGAIVALNFIVWAVDFFTPETLGGRWLTDHMAVHVDTLAKPWLWWQYLTAGFAHSPTNFQHILFNMLALFFLGRDVEDFYGPREFLKLYLVMVVFTAVVWNVVVKLAHVPINVQAYGASGAISGVVILYAMNFPRRTLLLFFVIPIPAWALGVLVVMMDALGSLGHGDQNVAYSMHLAGAAFAFVYCRRGWNFSRLLEGRMAWPRFRRKPRLRIHREEDAPTPNLNADVDRILEKIYREGEASLTPKERKILETASREYQRKMTKH